MWDEDEPRRDERRHAQPEVPRHRARKDRKRWCRGKPGVEHVPEVRLSKWGTYWRTAYPGRQLCGWSHWWRRDSEGRSVPDYSTWHWTCSHERGCSTCGKVLEPFLGKSCPEYAPRPA